MNSILSSKQAKYILMIVALLIVVLCVVFAVRNGSGIEKDNMVPANSVPPCICWDRKLYVWWGGSVKDTATIGPVLGSITEVISDLSTPKEHGQTNCSMFDGADVAQYGEDIAALADDEWMVFSLYRELE